MDNCVFCRILKNEISSRKVYETELVIVLLAKEMEVIWHSLILPKKHYKDITDIPKETLTELLEVTKKMIPQYEEKLWSTGMNIIAATWEAAQQSVPHFHFHLLPRFKDDGLDTRPVLNPVEVDKDIMLIRLRWEIH